jgi:hypothetical protein
MRVSSKDIVKNRVNSIQQYPYQDVIPRRVAEFSKRCFNYGSGLCKVVGFKDKAYFSWLSCGGVLYIMA